MSLSFKLEIKSVPVVIEQADGSETHYSIREMSAAARDRYLDRMSERMRMGVDGKPTGLKRYEGFQADLLSACLFDSKDTLVPVNEIQKWPASVVGDMFVEAQKLNRLDKDKADKDKEKEDSAKNG